MIDRSEEYDDGSVWDLLNQRAVRYEKPGLINYKVIADAFELTYGVPRSGGEWG